MTKILIQEIPECDFASKSSLMQFCLTEIRQPLKSDRHSRGLLIRNLCNTGNSLSFELRMQISIHLKTEFEFLTSLAMRNPRFLTLQRGITLYCPLS